MNHISDDAFTAVTGLIALIIDAKSCAKRISDLQATIAAAEQAQAQLEAASIANQRAFAEASADLERRRAKVTADEVDLRLRVSAFNQREARREAPPSIEDRYPDDPNFGPGSRSHTGLTREVYRND